MNSRKSGSRRARAFGQAGVVGLGAEEKEGVVYLAALCTVGSAAGDV